MKTRLHLLVASLLLATTSSALATVRYVNLNNANPTPPYTNWVTAAVDIQSAVDAAVAGDEIVVTNGLYAGGSGQDPYGDSDCVVVDKPLTLQSANGPDVTIINGGGAATCVYLTNNAVLVGFTLTNGLGGAFCESLSAVLTHCVLTGNSDGGAYDGTLNYCVLSGNAGGGADYCTLNNCTVTGNSGWGAGHSTLNNCAVSGNTGGGAYSEDYEPCTLNNCTVTGNSGWGASGAILNNCIVYFNSDPTDGGNYDSSSTLNYCCTTPLPTNGVGNLSADPQLASASHLSAESPCIGAGSVTYASGTDIDGDAWNNPPSIGCEEYRAGTVTGPLTVSLTAAYTNLATGFPLGLRAFIEGRADLSVWDFGDGSVQVNEPYTSHAWTAPGNYVVSLWAFNNSYPEGVNATVTVRILDHPVQYVALGSTNPVAPYLSWATAATNIQDAVDALGGESVVLVTNGTYAPVIVDKPLRMQSVNGPGVTVINGGGVARCVYLTDKAVLLGFTLTNGFAYDNGGGVYCESTNAVLTNCVLAGNSAFGWGLLGAIPRNGGGAYGGRLNNCTLTGNSAAYGGGACYSTLNNCTLSGNRVTPVNSGGWILGGCGGGAYGCILNNCTLTQNKANGVYGLSSYGDGGSGGGAFACLLNNCIVYFNSDGNRGNYDSASTFNYCCTTPLPSNGVGNISADPQLASASHLSAESPCIGAGSAAYATGTDLDGEAWANPPSMGCEEYHARAVTGPLTVSLTATWTNVATGYPVGLTTFIAGRTDLSVWDFGDGDVQVNEPYTSHSWTAAGDYLVSLWAFNDSYPEGVSATVTVRVLDHPVHYVALGGTNPVAPYLSWATAATNIQDAVEAWVPGAPVLVTNGVYVPIAVYEPLRMQSVNGPGVTVINGGGVARCVYLTDNAVLLGFTLTNGDAIQGGGVYCESTNAVLTNCVLTGNSGGFFGGGGAWGGTLNNCTLTGNTCIGGGFGGGGAFGSTLNNCTLTGNTAFSDGVGGGACGCALNNCTLISNWAWIGGGAADSTLNNCRLTGNSTSDGGEGGIGGGAADSTLNNCTLTGNSAIGKYAHGGGAASWSASCTLNNCIVYFNSDPTDGGNYDSSCTLNYCCTSPMPTNGVGNLTNAPLFVNFTNSNLCLQSNSPCINSGNNAYVVGSTDLDGNPRIQGGTVDIGAYEYQSPTSIISYAWLQQYGLPIDGSVDCADTDGTGMNNWQKWIAGLNPTNALSVLKMLAPSATSTPLGLVVTWQSVSNITYYLQRSTNLASQPAFSTIQSNIVGQAGTTSYTATNTVGSGPFFYRVGVSQ